MVPHKTKKGNLIKGQKKIIMMIGSSYIEREEL